jgi:hypothetical protein
VSFAQEQAQKLENTLASALAEAKEKESGVAEDSVPKDEQAAQASQLAAEALLGGFDDGKAAVKKRRGPNKDRTLLATLSDPMQPAENAMLKQPLQLRDVEVGSNKAGSSARTGKMTKKDQEQEQLLNSLDSDMRKVAVAHLSVNKTFSAKCLATLRVVQFFDVAGEHVRTHTLSSAGAGKIGACSSVAVAV